MCVNALPLAKYVYDSRYFRRVNLCATVSGASISARTIWTPSSLSLPLTSARAHTHTHTHTTLVHSQLLSLRSFFFLYLSSFSSLISASPSLFRYIDRFRPVTTLFRDRRTHLRRSCMWGTLDLQCSIDWCMCLCMCRLVCACVLIFTFVCARIYTWSLWI